MIRCEHFVYGLFNGYGYVLTKTDGVDKILSDKMLKKLLALQHDEQLLWPPQHPNKEFHISCTKIEPVKDEYKRVGIFNSTILVPLSKYLSYTQPLRIVKSYFMLRTDKPPEKLKPIKIKG